MSSDLDLGTVSVTLQAHVNDATAAVEDFKDEVNDIEPAAEGASSKLLLMRRAALVAAGALAIAGTIVAGMANQAMQYADEMDRASKISGVGAGNFSQLAHAASKVGVSAEQLGGTIRELTENVGKAADGSKKHALALRALGLEAEEFRKLAPEDQFETVAQRISELKDPADRSRAAIDLLGSAGAKLLPLFAEGAQGLKMAREEAVRLGKAMTDEQIAKLKAAKDEVDKLKIAWEGFSLSLGSKVAPQIAAVLRLLQGDTSMLAHAPSGADGKEAIIKRLQGQVKSLRDTRMDTSPEVSASRAAMADEIEAKIGRLQRGGDEQGGGHRGRRRTQTIGFDQASDDAEAESAIEKARKAANKAAAADERTRMQDILRERHAAMNELNSAMAENFSEQQRMREADALAAWDLEVQQFENEIAMQDAISSARAERLEEFRQGLMTAGEAEAERYAMQLTALDGFNQSELEMVGGYHAARERIEKEHQDRLADLIHSGERGVEDFLAMSWNNRLRTVVDAGEKMAGFVGISGKKMFNIHKATAIATALLDAKASVVGAYKWGASLGGPVLGAAFAAAAVAATGAHIKAIASQSYGGGGSVSASGAGSAPAAAAPEAPAQLIHIQGISEDALFSGKSVRTLLERMQEALNDGAKLVIN